MDKDQYDAAFQWLSGRPGPDDAAAAEALALVHAVLAEVNEIPEANRPRRSPPPTCSPH